MNKEIQRGIAWDPKPRLAKAGLLKRMFKTRMDPVQILTNLAMILVTDQA